MGVPVNGGQVMLAIRGIRLLHRRGHTWRRLSVGHGACASFGTLLGIDPGQTAGGEGPRSGLLEGARKLAKIAYRSVKTNIRFLRVGEPEPHKMGKELSPTLSQFSPQDI